MNGDAAYRLAGRSWSWPLAFTMTARPDLGFPQDVAVQLDLRDGGCKSARALPAREVTAPYVLRGTYDTWEGIARGTTDPVAAVMRRDLQLAKGAITTLMMHTAWAQALLKCVQRVPTVDPEAA